MDLQIAFLCSALFVAIAVAVYIISVFGVKQKTFEEAIEEQRQRRDKEILQQAKTEKPKKEKKYKKLTKRSKEKVVPSEEEFHPVIVDPHVDFKTEAEIFPLDADPEVKPAKAKKKPKLNQLAPKSILTNKQEGGGLNSEGVIPLPNEHDDSDPPTPPAKVPKDEVERKLSLSMASIGSQFNAIGDGASKELLNRESKGKSQSPEVKVQEMQTNKKKREQSKSPEKEKEQKEEVNLVAQVPNTVANKKTKKTKQDNIDIVDGDVSVKKLVALLKNANFVGDEIQLLIDFLLTKQQNEAAEWTKKNDPVAALKKQLQEKEQQLEEEVRKVQAISSKTKELRQELNQEKTRFNANERNAREKVVQQQQEINTLQETVKRNRISQAETLSKVQQLQQLKTEVNDREQQLKNEVNELEQQISQLQAEKQSWVGREIQLQRDLEQFRSAQEQSDSSRASLEQDRDLLKQQVLRLETQAKELRDLEHRNTSLGQELQHAKNTCNTLECEKNAFQKRLDANEQQHCKIEDEMHNLKSALRESQSKQHESEKQAEQQMNLVKNLENKNSDYVQQGKESKAEIEHLRSQLLQVSVRTAAEGQEESPVHQQNGEVARDEQEKKDVEHTKIIEEKEKLMMQLKEEIGSQKTQIITLTDELENQKEKNNELREKNWKAMDNLNAVETSTQKKVKELEERLQEEVKRRPTSDAEDRLKEISRTSEEKVQQFKKANEELVQRIQKEQEKEREVLQRLFPEIQLDKKMDQMTWVQSYEKCACQLLSNLRSPTNSSDLSHANERIAELNEQNVKLEAMVQHYKTVLSDTEDILKKLQSGVEAAELEWLEKLGAKEQELQKVLAEKKVLEVNLKEHQSLDVATSEVRELQAKLKELQSKLQGEEHEKKLLEQKFGEVNKNTEDLKDQIEGKKIELEELRSEKLGYEKNIKDLEKIRSDLEKEKKITKELSAHTVKLQSLVKIGQDALQAEQELVKSLQAQLELSTVAATNGTSVTPAKLAPELDSVSAPVKTDKPNKHKKRAALGKK